MHCGYSGVLTSVLTGYSYTPGGLSTSDGIADHRVRLARARLAVREERRVKARPRVREHLWVPVSTRGSTLVSTQSTREST